MSTDARARTPEATFTAALLIAGGALLVGVTMGLDLLKGRGWEFGRLQMAGAGLGAGSILLGLAFLRLPLARRIASRLWPFGTEAPVRSREIFAFALWLGVLSGALEVGLRLLQFETGWRWGTLNPHSIWMVPLVDAVSLAGIAIPLAVFSRRRLPRLGSPRFAAFVLLALAVGTPLSLFTTELRRVSVALLTLGVAFQASRWLAARPGGTRAWVRRTAVPVAAVLALLAIAPPARQAWSERRALAAMPDAPPGASSVLLVILDTVRAHNMSLYGYARRTTPWLEELARRSTVFERAYAPSSWTLPSHGSFFTGRPPHRQSGNSFTPLDDALPTLSEVLRDRGYYTLGVVANSDNAFPHTGLDRGFVRYDASTAAVWEMAQASRLGALWRWGIERFGIHLPTRKDAETVNERFLAAIDRRGGRPFFAFLNYYDAHYPFDDPPALATSIEGWSDNPVEVVGKMEPYVTRSVDEYDREIAYLDERLEALFATLADRGLLDDTIVIVASDHGEEFTEHGLLGHGFNVYDTTLHVPLIVSRPGRVPQGLRIARPVGLENLPATIMELAGLREGSPFEGENLLAAGSEPAGSGEPVLSEVAVTQPGGETPAPWNYRSLVWGTLHYVRNPDASEEIYDLRTDRWETRDLNADGAGPRLPEFRSALALRIDDLTASGGQPQGQ